MKANDQWRIDPDRLSAAKALDEAHQSDLAEVEDLLARAMAIAIKWVPQPGIRDAELGRRFTKIFFAHHNLTWWIGREGTDTYYGNLAAFGDGWDERNDCAIQHHGR